MNINDQFPSKWLKASDLQGDTPVTMSHITTETVSDDQLPVLYFQGAQKGLVLNKTNANSISSVYGPETDGWMGKQMVLVSAWTDYQGQRVACIRLNPPQQQMQTAVMHQDGQVQQQPAQPNVGFVPNLSTGQGQQTPAASIFTQPGGQPGPQQIDERNPPPAGKAIDDEIPF